MNTYESHPRRLPTAAEYAENITRIKEIEERISALKREIDLLEIERVKRRSFTCAFRRLPAELLAEIASRCIDLGESPQKLNQISWSLREAVNGTKRFWTSINLWRRVAWIGDPYVPYTEPWDEDPYVSYRGSIPCNNPNYLKIVLGRASPMPLTVRIENPSTVAELINNLVPISDLINHLSLVTREAITLDLPVLKLTGLRSLILETMKEADPCRSWIYACLAFTSSGLYKFTGKICYHDLETIFGQTAILNATDISVDLCDHVGESRQGNAIVLSQVQSLSMFVDTVLLQRIFAKKLRHLRLKGVGNELFARHIPGCETLESLELDGVSIFAEAQDTCYFPKLTTVRLKRVYHTPSRIIVAPQLEELVLIDANPEYLPWEEVRTEVCDMINGRGIFGPLSLKKLTLGSMDLDEAMALSLAVQPLLTVLEIRGCRLRSFLTWLGNGDGKSSVTLPSLEEIHFVKCICMDRFYDVKEFAAFLAENRPEVRVFIRQ